MERITATAEVKSGHHHLQVAPDHEAAPTDRVRKDLKIKKH
jgi:hypothetical protein